MTPAGFPHSDISGSKSARDSPELFAACHVLHRLLAPRHPPRALCSLTPSVPDPAVTERGNRYIGITSTTRRNRRSQKDFSFCRSLFQLVRCVPRIKDAKLRVAMTPSDPLVGGLRRGGHGSEELWVGARREVVETRRLELLTLSLQRRCSTS
jgi:hypothetical protein